jgi:hypothetical protein
MYSLGVKIADRENLIGLSSSVSTLSMTENVLIPGAGCKPSRSDSCRGSVRFMRYQKTYHRVQANSTSPPALSRFSAIHLLKRIGAPLRRQLYKP